MTQEVKVFATKPFYLSLVPRSHRWKYNSYT